MTKRNAVLALATLALAATSAGAQERSSTQGFVVGAGLNGSSLKVDGSDEQETGAGLSLLVGYNFTPRIGVFLSGSAASMDEDGGSYTLSQGDLSVRYTFASAARALAPYLEAGFTTLSAEGDGDLELSGQGFTGAVGLNYFFNPRLALDANLRFTSGEFEAPEAEGDAVAGDDRGVTSGRFNVGVSYFF